MSVLKWSFTYVRMLIVGLDELNLEEDYELVTGSEPGQDDAGTGDVKYVEDLSLAVANQIGEQQSNHT